MLYVSLLLFITKKACDFMFPERMNKFYMAIALHSLNAYANTNMLIRRYYNLIYFYFVKLNDSIIFIKDGNEIKECIIKKCIINQQLIDTPDDYYDMILYKHYANPNDTSSNKLKKNVIRLSNCIEINQLKIPHIIPSNIKFIDIKVSYNDKTYNIDFSSDNNYYIVGNILFDRAFIKWYCKTFHNVTIDDDDDYICNILDNSVTFIQIDSSAHIVIGLDDYTIENTKDLEETQL